jgi:hypothetical protein
VSEPPLSPLEADLVDAYLRRNGEVEQRAEEDGGAAGILRELLEGGADPFAADAATERAELPGGCGLLHRGVATLLFAERGAGKSWVALTLALSVARSERVLYSTARTACRPSGNASTTPSTPSAGRSARKDLPSAATRSS